MQHFRKIGAAVGDQVAGRGLERFHEQWFPPAGIAGSAAMLEDVADFKMVSAG
jgi:hypothetical protein